jgi:GLPGLI family protein
MKFIVIICLILTRSLAGYGQVFEGTVKYIESYNWVRSYDSLDFYSEDYKKGLFLKYQAPITYRFFSLVIHKDSSSYQESRSNDGSNRYFHRYDWSDNTVLFTGELMKKDFLVKDKIKRNSWVVKDEIKEVLGHICMKAVSHDYIKKQQIVAWFALDIEGPNGPDRYIGLPGLILEIDINNGAKVIKAMEVSTGNTKFPPMPKKLPRNEYTCSSFEAYVSREMSRLLSNNLRALN